jgi:hypothetical protein
MPRDQAEFSPLYIVVVGILACFLTPSWTQAQGPTTVTFADAAGEAGVSFVHSHGGSGMYYSVETMGSGVALADLDLDGWLDLYFAQNAPTPEYVPSGPMINRMFRGRGDGTFDDITELSGAADDSYSMSVSAGDYDNDGFPDLFVGNFGPNRLYRNNGDGTFSDVTEETGVMDDLWAASAAWADIDADGDLDLYVSNYVNFTWATNKYCGDPVRDLPAYCHPDVYDAVPDRLYRNEGDGTFTEVGEQAGVANDLDGKGLGVVFGDYDNDHDLDVYVANDSTRNFLYTNDGTGNFSDDGFLSGVSYNEDGRTEAGMGVDWGDFDGDGLLDIIVTNLTLETNTLYRNLGEGLFADESFVAGVGVDSLMMVGFGINWWDYDNDGDLDLFVNNGHVVDNIEEFADNVEGSPLSGRTYPQQNHVYRNEGGGAFQAVQDELGEGFQLMKVGRGSAIGDVDNDGDLDVVIANSNQSADYLRNEGGNEAGNWLQLMLQGRESDRYAVGARVIVERPGEQRIVLESKAGSSYCSSSDIRIHVGLGSAPRGHVTVRWPKGGIEDLGELEAGNLYLVRQGIGVIASRTAF